ncbi:MAG TPA: BTAD domain-containing putative transcriptional regulator, partial [Gaiellaceae bacterium]|nr:BTAD domain-containing putative transcriptional regulator [Gaiellaceae bacterium]
MEFAVLGPLRVRSDDGAPEPRVGAQHGLLAVLLTSPNVAISDDRLIDELWGGDPPASARHLLQVYASELRGLLGRLPDGPRIVRDRNGYALRVQPNELDAERFETAVVRTRELQEVDPEAADGILAEAMRLWRGAPFTGVRHPSPAVRTQAEYLERLHLEGLEIWIEARLQLGRHRELVSELSALVAEHPYDEALHAQLMLALYRCGRQAEALETARALESRLRDDLAVEASAQVRDLYRRILLQVPELMLEPPEPPSNLPGRLTTFVGRSRELQEVIELVEASRLATLTGPGGVGKTRLAVEAAQRLRPRFPGGVWWIDLASVTDPGLVADEAARVLGLTVMPGQEVVAAVARAFGRRRALVLVDNCEHVATAAAELAAAVVGGTAGPYVLATSRTPLRVEGEHLWTVPPLSLPADGAQPAELVEFDAVRLFVERGRAVDPSFALDAGTAPAVL